jgi:hypothetical protein
VFESKVLRKILGHEGEVAAGRWQKLKMSMLYQILYQIKKYETDWTSNQH